MISSTYGSSTCTSRDDYYATVSRVIDGDTLELSNGYRVRLADIDAPEKYESGYLASTEALESWVLGERFYLDLDDIHETDSYGRLVCVVYVEHDSGYFNVKNQLVVVRWIF